MDDTESLRELFFAATSSQSRPTSIKAPMSLSQTLLSTLVSPPAGQGKTNTRTDRSAEPESADDKAEELSSQQLAVDGFWTLCDTLGAIRVSLNEPVGKAQVSSLTIARVASTGSSLRSDCPSAAYSVCNSSCIAYVLHNTKIRLIAQENGARELVAVHSSPIVKLGWSDQDLEQLDWPTDSFLGSLSSSGQVSVGIVFAEGPQQLKYEAFSMVDLAMKDALGFIWMTAGRKTPSLVVYGSEPELIFVPIRKRPAPTPRRLPVEDFEKIKAVVAGFGEHQVVVFDEKKASLYTIQSSGLKLVDTYVARGELLNVALVNSGKEASLQDSLVTMESMEGRLHLRVGGQTVEFSGTASIRGASMIYDSLSKTVLLAIPSIRRIYALVLSGSSGCIRHIMPYHWDCSQLISMANVPQLRAALVGEHARRAIYWLAYREEQVESVHVELPEALVAAHKQPSRPSSREGATRPKEGGSEEPFESSADRDRQAKTGQRSSQACSSDMEASLLRHFSKGVADALAVQHQTFQNELAERSQQEARRQERLLAMVSDTLNKNVTVVLQALVRSELQKALPKALQDAIENASTMKAVGTVVDHAIGRAISKEKLEAAVSNLPATIDQVVAKTMRETFEQKVIPSYQQATDAMFQQASAAIQKAQSCSAEASQAQLAMASATEAMRAAIEAFSGLQTDEIAAAVAKDLRQSLSETPMRQYSTSSVSPKPDARKEIMELLDSQDYAKATYRVLFEGDLVLLNWFIGLIDPTQTLESAGLSQPVLLSLAQQLGCELASETNSKLDWLQEVLTLIDSRDGSISESLSPVMTGLFDNLKEAFAGSESNSTIHKKLKVVMRLARMLS